MTDQKETLLALLREDFGSFLRKVFQTLNPGVDFIPGWHIDAIVHRLELIHGGDVTQQIIAMPPRYLKSTIVSVAYVAWVLGKNPTACIICASYADDLAKKFSRDTRIIMMSAWYKKAFPKTRLAKITETELTTTMGGFRLATSVEGIATGRGGNLIIIDDPIKVGDAFSNAEREKVNNWSDQTMSTRLDDKKNGAIVVVMQRVHENDLVGHLLEKGGWAILKLPAIATEPEDIPIGPNNFHQRIPGDVLHPEREDRERLEQNKTNMGSFAFAAQYQQSPVPPEGNMFKPNWFKTFDNRRGQDDYELIVQSWDTASGTSNSNSYSVCLTFGIKEKRYYLLDVLRERMDFPTLKARVIRHAKNWGANHILIEKASSGLALLQLLFRETSLPLIPVPVDTNKENRVARVSSYIEAGRVFLPKEAPWLAAFMQEILAFPHGKFDDQVDALTQFLYWAQERDYRPQGRYYVIGGRSGDRYYDRTGEHTF